MNAPLIKPITSRRLVIVESPYAAFDDRSIADNEAYLRRCLRDSWDHGELPFASHAFFPQFLCEELSLERKEGIESGYQFWEGASAIIFYADYGVTPGMQQALIRAEDLYIPTKLRCIETRPITSQVSEKESLHGHQS